MMRKRPGALLLTAVAIPLFGAGAWAAAASIGTKPAPQVVVPPESATVARRPGRVPASVTSTSTSTSVARVDDRVGRTATTDDRPHGERHAPDDEHQRDRGPGNDRRHRESGDG